MIKHPSYTSNQIIAKEGIKTILIVFGCVLFGIFIHCEIFTLFSLLLLILSLFVFRNSERILEYRGEGLVASPCDGKLVEYSFTNNQTILKFKVSVADVGVFRTPLDIDCNKIFSKQGLFLEALSDLSDILNTRYIIDGLADGKIIYSITLYPEVWNKVSVYKLDNAIKGDRMGFIKYGYLVLCINDEIDMLVSCGNSVFAGQTIIGKLKSTKERQ